MVVKYHSSFLYSKMSSILNCLGLTFRNTGFLKFNMFFPVLMAGAHFSLKAFGDADVAQILITKSGVPSKKFPFFVLTMLPVIAIVCAIGAIMGLTIYSKTGYESQNSRGQKDPSNLKKIGVPDWISRMQGAQYNTWETTISFLCTLYAAQNTGVSSSIIVNVSAYVLLCRLLYPIMYVFDLDFFRTCMWYFAFQAMLMMAFAGCFPGVIAPLLE